MGAIHEDIVAEARRITDSARAGNLIVRVLGGVAVRLHAPDGVHPALARPYRDIDLVAPRKQGKATARLLNELGYMPNERFNAMNGASRLVFYDEEHGRQVDVFLGTFVMCHELPLAGRLELVDPSVPLAELLLTEVQILRIGEQDLLDVWGIL